MTASLTGLKPKGKSMNTIQQMTSIRATIALLSSFEGTEITRAQYDKLADKHNHNVPCSHRCYITDDERAQMVYSLDGIVPHWTDKEKVTTRKEEFDLPEEVLEEMGYEATEHFEEVAGGLYKKVISYEDAPKGVRYFYSVPKLIKVLQNKLADKRNWLVNMVEAREEKICELRTEISELKLALM